MPEKCKDCCSRFFCMSVAEVNEEDFETMANKKDCRKRVFTNADRIRAMSDEELSVFLWEFEKEEIARATEYALERRKITEWLKQPVE